MTVRVTNENGIAGFWGLIHNFELRMIANSNSEMEIMIHIMDTFYATYGL